ncbi:MAG: hypothetical protein HZY76_13285 [Anaerolineae bacterium]|nr:MAG: hypothetical protein HZY76_13285 [Anaerolineae bacterium]
MRQVPVGVIILAIIYITLAVLSILWSLLVFGVGSVTVVTASLFGSDPGSALAAPGWRLAYRASSSPAWLVVGIGLFTLKRWAWLLAVVVAGITLVEGILGMFGGGCWPSAAAVWGS